MSKIKLFFVCIILLTASACSVQASPTPAPQPITIIEVIASPTAQGIPLSEADVPRITVEKAKAAIESGAAVVVDVRSKTAYDAQHIAGAISIPFTEIQANPTAVKLDKDQWIITYCTWRNEHTSAGAAFLLSQNGYTRVEAILGGYEAWTDAGYPVEPWGKKVKT